MLTQVTMKTNDTWSANVGLAATLMSAVRRGKKNLDPDEHGKRFSFMTHH
jgi:hypothetical protein